MKEEYIPIPLRKNEEKKRFEIFIDGLPAFIDYKEMGEQIALIHTETDKQLAGRGAATAVVEKTLQWIEEQNKTLLPFCPYVFAYIQRHPEWKKIVDPRFNAYDKLWHQAD